VIRAVPELDSTVISYIQTVEQLFLLLRRQGLMLSPEDMNIAHQWADAGVPLRLACATIVDTVERFKKTHGEETPLPSTLRYFSKAVHQAVEAEHKRQLIAPEEKTHETDESVSTGIIDQLIDELVLIGQSESDHRVRDAYRDAYKNLRDLHNENPGSLLPSLLSIDTGMLHALWNSLSEQEQARFRHEVDTQIEKERNRLGVRGLEERTQSLLNQVLTTHFNLFRLWPGRSD
jgi:hypothetical protein